MCIAFTKFSFATRSSVLLALVSAYLIATLYPFNFQINRAKLHEGRASFANPGLLHWTGDPFWMKSQDLLRLELLVKPRLKEQFGPARILTISRDHRTTNLTVAQEGPDLIFRLRRAMSNDLGLPSYKVSDIWDPSSFVAIEIEVRRDEFFLTTDGKVRLHEKFTDSPFLRWDDSLRLALGNELTLHRAWLGEIRAARLQTSDHDVDLLYAPELRHWSYWDQLKRRLSHTPYHLTDAAVNFLAMVPLGIISALIFGSRTWVLLAVWGGVCFSAEALQVMQNTRHPSALDLGLNVFGIFIGIVAKRHVTETRLE